ncbi:TIGR02269 family lipoprotein [Archangium sp. Cb G35]|uniref:SitA6 family polymorphic toxin lipoprotein n=1 Tax=Archangium sp. Cb G35 TaxID=1920190 RepID=UPI000A4B3C4D|nr:TIGR02269 family lipoprotein [Archangium sp. Cb G35]
MRVLPWKSWLALLGLLLSACATTPAPGESGFAEDVDPVASWEEAREDPSCVVPLCDEERCALWRCEDVVEVEEHPVVLALANGSLRPPPNPTRWWGRPLAVPGGREAVFEIPWHNWNIRGQYAPRVLKPPCVRAREPLEKHHIFPQALATWFKRKPIDIHAYTIRLPKSFHQWLHSGSFPGGQWNEAWSRFQRQNDNATIEEIWKFAGELMSRFRVNGPLVSYYCD